MTTLNDEHRFELLKQHCLTDHHTIIKSVDLVSLMFSEHPALHHKEHEATHVGVPHPED